MNLTEDVKQHIRFIAENMMPEETNWLTVKKQLLITLSPKDRAHFTRRDELTKNHYPFNEFECDIRLYWYELTGNTLLMPPEKMLAEYDPEAYI